MTGGFEVEEPALLPPTPGSSPDKFDELLMAARATMDPAEQTPLLEQAHARLSSELAEALGD